MKDCNSENVFIVCCCILLVVVAVCLTVVKVAEVCMGK